MKIDIGFCPNCGCSDFSRSRSKYWHCAKCDFTYFHNTAAAVAAVIRHGEEILLTIRKSDPGQGLLDMPGGFVDPGESLEDALTREIEEELKFRFHSWTYLFSYPNLYEYRGITYHTADAFFLADLDARPVLEACDDVDGITWQPIGNIDKRLVAFSSMRMAVDRLTKAF